MASHLSLTMYTAVLAVLGTTIGTAETKVDPLTMKLSAYTAPFKAEVTVQARVEPDARSRELVIEWVADDLSGGSHTISLNGARAAAVHHYPLKHMAPGQYVVTATLRLRDGTEIQRASHLSVVGMGGPYGSHSGGRRGSAAAPSRLTRQ
jgi:hypothetical protein